jgi:hypothetical protein
MRKSYLFVVFFMIIFLNACGGGSEKTVKNESPETSIAAVSQLAFYLPSWFDQSGEIKISSQNGEVITSLETASLNSEVLTINANQVIFIEYIPSSKNIVCPDSKGCANSNNSFHEDSNGNNIIDHNEVFSVDSIFSARLLLSPGANKVYFSLLSSIEASHQVNSHLKSLSVTPNYHQTYADIEYSQRYQYLADCSYFALFSGSESTTPIAEIKESLASFIQSNEISTTTISYFTNIAKYLSQLQINNDDDLLNSYLIEEKFKLNRLLASTTGKEQPSHSNDLHDKVLLEQFRDILAFINVQELKYNNEVNDKVAELSTVFTDDSENTTAIFSEVLAEILQLYSPVNNTLAGIYYYKGLDINYSGSPYTWLISGIYKGIEVNLELTIPQWRISAARGDFFVATISGNVSSANTTLSINTDELLLKFDGVEDVFNDEKAKTAIFNLITNISIATENGEINGRINIEGERAENENGQLFSVLKQFSFLGLLNTENQTTNISLMAAKYSNALEQNEDDFIYNILLDLPSSGSSDFRLSISGSNTNFELLDNVNLALKMQGKVLELNLTQLNDTRVMKIKGLDGRWLMLEQKKKDYSGHLYFGDLIIGEVITVRSLPGVLFPNGDFHSIF